MPPRTVSAEFFPFSCHLVVVQPSEMGWIWTEGEREESRFMNAVFLTTMGEKGILDAYDEDTRKALASSLYFVDPVYREEDLEGRRKSLASVDVIFSTWGMLSLTEEQIQQYFPSLKAVFYAAGSVQYFARPFLNHGVRVFSAASANGIPVAEYTTAQIILANKGFFQAARLYKRASHEKAQSYAHTFPCNYNVKVGIIGAGVIGRLVIKMLKGYEIEPWVFDPFLPEERARELGVKKYTLEEIFSSCQTISNHLANNAQTKGMLDYRLFSMMKDNAAFINTGRGAQVVEADLVRALKEKPGRVAVLDVTDPEPVVPGSEIHQLENVFLTPHIAGSMNNEIARMGKFMLEDYEKFAQDAPVNYEVTMDMLATMA